MNAYLYQDKKKPAIQTVKKSAGISKKTLFIQTRPQTVNNINKNVLKNSSHLFTGNASEISARSFERSNRQPLPQTSQNSSSGQTEKLLLLLHAAIQHKQQYPLSALQMARQGKVQLGFKLYPNGTISNLRLIKSSGVESLDTSALEAVRLAAPFENINAYLKTSQDFSINVTFALTEDNA